MHRVLRHTSIADDRNPKPAFRCWKRNGLHLGHSGQKQTEALNQQKTEMHRVLRHTSIFFFTRVKPRQESTARLNAGLNGKTQRQKEEESS